MVTLNSGRTSESITGVVLSVLVSTKLRMWFAKILPHPELSGPTHRTWLCVSTVMAVSKF